AMIAAGTIALLFRVNVPEPVRTVGEAALAVIAALFVAAAWIAWRRPSMLGGSAIDSVARHLPPRARSLVDRLGGIEAYVYALAARRAGAMAAMVVLELLFHVFGVLEAYLTRMWIRGVQPPLLSAFVLETVNRLITVAFKFVPFQVGVAEAGTAVVADV